MCAGYDNWGRTDRRRRHAIDASALGDGHWQGGEGAFLPFGNGRSYGDTCHNDSGTLIDSRRHAKIHDFDRETGILVADAGTLLSEILTLILPAGHFLPVTPGTAFVTLGGAIANDVHGKNHHKRGTFGNHVLSLTLKRSDGSELTCSRTENVELFRATIGGMGLTGLIVSAEIRLMPVPSANIRQRAIRFDRIDRYFEIVDDIDAQHEYSVAWIDQLASGRSLGRGVLLAGDHAKNGGEGAAPSKARLNVPFQPPISALNRASLSLFNTLQFHRHKAGETISTVPWRPYFYPLDAVGSWNRLYGPRGLHQHQSVYPVDDAARTTVRLLECARAHGHASFLTVLKRFGTVPSPGVLSFPRPGFTLTLDFPNRGAKTHRLLAALDEIVLEAGGAVNPYKDSRMPAPVFKASFPQWRDVEALRDPAIMSDFWRRTAMTLGNHDAPDRRQAAE